MRVAQVTATYPPYHDRMGAIAREYTTRLRLRGYDVHVSRRSATTADQTRATFIACAVRGVGNAALMPSIYPLLGPFDIVHLHYPFFGCAEFVVVQKMRNARQTLVVTYCMDASAAGVKGVAFGVYGRIVLPYVVAHADHILVSSLDYAQNSALASFLGLLDCVEVHRFGVDLDQFCPGTEPTLREQLGISPHEPVLGAVISASPGPQ